VHFILTSAPKPNMVDVRLACLSFILCIFFLVNDQFVIFFPFYFSLPLFCLFVSLFAVWF
jgi:hypothetical protein